MVFGRTLKKKVCEMQFPFFSWRQAILKSNLAPTTRHVLLTLACHMNDAGESCYPSIALLCEETGLSNRSVIDHLAKAEELGWIVVDQHGFRGQKWKRNEYRIAWPKVLEGGEPPSPPLAEGGEPNNVKVVKEVHTSTSVSTSKTICTEQPLVADAVRFDGVRWSIDNAVFDGWLIAYQNGRTHQDTEDWIEAELAKAALWLQANPRKRKKNYLRFLSGWLTRASTATPYRKQQQPRPYH